MKYIELNEVMLEGVNITGEEWSGTLRDLLNDVFIDGRDCTHDDYKLEDSVWDKFGIRKIMVGCGKEEL